MGGILRVADLRQQVYEVLKGRILRGEFASDAKFQEISLADELGVSRTPVREALAMLAADGIIVQASRGFRFPQFTRDEIIEVFEVRMLIEPYAVGKLVEQTEPMTLETLAGWMKREIETAGNTEAYLDAHRRVRQRLFAHVGNRQLIEAINRYEDAIHLVRIRTLRTSAYRTISIVGMLALVDAIGIADAALASARIRNLLGKAQNAYLSSLPIDGTDGSTHGHTLS